MIVPIGLMLLLLLRLLLLGMMEFVSRQGLHGVLFAAAADRIMFIEHHLQVVDVINRDSQRFHLNTKRTHLLHTHHRGGICGRGGTSLFPYTNTTLHTIQRNRHTESRVQPYGRVATTLDCEATKCVVKIMWIDVIWT